MSQVDGDGVDEGAEQKSRERGWGRNPWFCSVRNADSILSFRITSGRVTEKQGRGHLPRGYKNESRRGMKRIDGDGKCWLCAPPTIPHRHIYR